MKVTSKKVITSLAIVTILIIAAVIAIIGFSSSDAKEYKKALGLIESKDYIEASKILSEIDYKDSKEKLKEISPAVEILEAKEGDIIYIGSYEQDGDDSNGSEVIGWAVLKSENGKVLAVSKAALDCLPYNESISEVTFEDSTLGTYLNNEFKDSIFSADESSLFGEIKISLLSREEIEEYLIDAKCVPTAYAVSRGEYCDESGYCMYWLKDSGLESGRASYVYTDGNIDNIGYWYDGDMLAVRPIIEFDFN